MNRFESSDGPMGVNSKAYDEGSLCHT